jgi:hypothetical protein
MQHVFGNDRLTECELSPGGGLLAPPPAAGARPLSARSFELADAIPRRATRLSSESFRTGSVVKSSSQTMRALQLSFRRETPPAYSRLKMSAHTMSNATKRESWSNPPRSSLAPLASASGGGLPVRAVRLDRDDGTCRKMFAELLR